VYRRLLCANSTSPVTPFARLCAPTVFFPTLSLGLVSARYSAIHECLTDNVIFQQPRLLVAYIDPSIPAALRPKQLSTVT
jgi:hypothetical protein